ncbi:dTDP-4-dehydrorhamnose reductase [candidate division WOR-1 bacterium RIFOXYC2_FULL_37_10]|uniref:dTDP-4-dehydrorhamnose reductase n=1 Tax=candidate division WOR-1 bacterium RIFOXYB2_FULL_37_13 TaxID=1802579 RepID=A0A1F4SP22_UNCSA|nr:MAG: dTDP-4-dehydrorhamnose reductase [candidate division WOR-1 bacterium RIFOXYB2_FULL_37_13]OGC37069.1 MAG: dTDP-4-dehydrorhamnose reductase [candidate division WOR-1 bacterium RIFOXYC2_FULL_37_10]
MKIAVIGADGQLGTDLCKVIPESERIPLTLKDIDITDFDSALNVLTRLTPDVVINTAAYHRVDDCEDNDLLAYKVNAHGARNLALACKLLNAALVHISTDYVFDGEKKSPYVEEDTPNPKTAYGISKLAGEEFIKYLWQKYFIIRTSGLYGVAGCLGKGGGNFVENMIKRQKEGQTIKVVDDEVLTPTYTFHLASQIEKLIKTDKYGLYHITNQGECSWWEYTVKIFEMLNIRVEVARTKASEYKTKANRPKYSVLENKRSKEIGLDIMPPWEVGLAEYLQEKGYKRVNS